jgi:hypothetical protein
MEKVFENDMALTPNKVAHMAKKLLPHAGDDAFLSEKAITESEGEDTAAIRRKNMATSDRSYSEAPFIQRQEGSS